MAAAYRLYTTPDGESHFEDYPQLFAIGPQKEAHLVQQTKGAIFWHHPKAMDFGWHNTPRRQYVVVLEGTFEIGASDGVVKILRAGDVVLLEDTHGKGHTARISAGRKSIFIHLEDLKPGA